MQKREGYFIGENSEFRHKTFTGKHLLSLLKLNLEAFQGLEILKWEIFELLVVYSIRNDLEVVGTH